MSGRRPELVPQPRGWALLLHAAASGRGSAQNLLAGCWFRSLFDSWMQSVEVSAGLGGCSWGLLRLGARGRDGLDNAWMRRASSIPSRPRSPVKGHLSFLINLEALRDTRSFTATPHAAGVAPPAGASPRGLKPRGYEERRSKTLRLTNRSAALEFIGLPFDGRRR